jgi:hypothetical protein
MEQVEAHLVVRATGFQREDWYRLLDARHAQAWEFDEITRWLEGNTKLDDWWARNIAESYVAARGIGQIRELPNGLFATSVSHDFTIELARVFTVLVDLQNWPTRPEPRMLLRKENERFQVVFEDASRAMVTFVEHEPSYVTVVVAHELLETARDAELVETYWTALLTSVATRLGVR